MIRRSPAARATTGRRHLSLVLLLAVVLGTFGAAARDGGDYTLHAEFSRTYNLFPGSPVMMLGVEIGRISDLKIAPGSTFVDVVMRIDGTVAVPADGNAIIIPASLLGERYVQLGPVWTGGPVLEDGGVIPNDRTIVPAEFDEVLESLNRFVGGLDEKEFGRFVDNLADALTGNGSALGRTIDNAAVAIEVLKDNDDQLIALASRLADLNETLSTRQAAFGQIIEDWYTVTRSLAEDRDDIDAALRGLVRITDALAGVLETNRPNLDADIATLTRIAQTADRNIDELSRLTLSGAELFRHAERVFDFEHNWLPLVNHTSDLERLIGETVAARLIGVCGRAELPTAVCEGIDQVLGGALCATGIIACDPGMLSVGQGLSAVFEAYPELEAIYQQRTAMLESGQVPDDVPEPLREGVKERWTGGGTR